MESNGSSGLTIPKNLPFAGLERKNRVQELLGKVVPVHGRVHLDFKFRINFLYILDLLLDFENMGQEILDKFRKEVIAGVKKQIEDEQYQRKKMEMEWTNLIFKSQGLIMKKLFYVTIVLSMITFISCSKESKENAACVAQCLLSEERGQDFANNNN